MRIVTKSISVTTEPFGQELEVLSRITNPIADLTLLHRPLLFADLASVSYDAVIVIPVAAMNGFRHCRFIERDGAQAYVLPIDTAQPAGHATV